MKDLYYSIEVLYPKDKSQLIDNYTEVVANILKNKLDSCNIEQLLLKLNNIKEQK